MAVSLPTAADIRKVRSRATEAVNQQINVVRTPVLAWIGAGELALNKVNEAFGKALARATEGREQVQARAERLQKQVIELPTELRERLDGERLRQRYAELSDQARKSFTELADRGGVTVERLRRQPRFARAISVLEDATERFDRRVEQVVDEVHDAGEEVLGRVSVETRSLGERAARAAKRLSGSAADTVTEASAKVAEEVTEAGDAAASNTRSATRKAANKTAPRKTSSATRRSGNGTTAANGSRAAK